MPVHICPRCQRIFDRKSNYEQHLRRKVPCPVSNKYINGSSIDKKDHIQDSEKVPINLSLKDNYKYTCEFCGQNFTRVSNMKRHQESRCIISQEHQKNYVNDDFHTIENVDKSVSLRDFISLCNEVEKLKNAPPIQVNNQNILQVLCIKSDDNYLDMLTSQWGNFKQALDFIKDCALSSINGDCKLLNKIYFESKKSSEAPIKYSDKSHNNIEYYNDKQERIIDYRGQRLGKILANNLQNSYLKGVNYLINQNLENGLCPNKFLDDYDVQSWNAHIYELSDIKYQKKIVSQLDIPVVQ